MVDVKMSASYLETMLSLVDESKLTPEMLEQHKIVLADLQSAQKAEKQKLLLAGLNDIMLLNAKTIQEKLNTIDIPESINTVKLPFLYDKDKETFFPSSQTIAVDTSFPLITRVIREIVSSIDKQAKPVQTAMISVLNEAGKTTYAVDDFVDLVTQKQSWISGSEAEIAKLNVNATGLGLMLDIDIAQVNSLETDKGSVVFSYNSLELLKKTTPETEATTGTWHITACGFGKATKYTPKLGNGIKAKASDWIPAGYEATTVKGYVVERFSDDTKIAQLIASGTDYNANQHLLRLEKTLPESERAYTEFKSKE
ncbi:hypothetical protein LCGC14_0578250 [marine sediment metagenome]|uniref:Uncharacterized protein n=1 Tax=marine sediment metagenome TaxID=412755 RepID=A0A0F9RM82_9ZZZZ